MCYGRGAVGGEEAHEGGSRSVWRRGWQVRRRVGRGTADMRLGHGGRDVNLVLRRGQFLVICGEVGASKSTLLTALAQALPLSGGRVMVTGMYE